jgi:hypothetical protein
MDNILCLPFYLQNNYVYIHNNEFEAGIRYSKIGVTMVLSENPPLNHEWDVMIKETYENNLKEEEIYKRRYVSKNDFKLFDKEYDDTFEEVGGSIKLDLVKSNILDYDGTKYNSNQDLKFYIRNYIGFKNVEELKNFKKIFNDKDPRDNPLYKLSSSGHNPLIEIIISCVFLVIISAYALILKFEKLQNIKDLLYYIFIGIIIIFLVAGLIIMVFHFIKYPPIYIDMDKRMKNVLNAYNKRIALSQLFRVISLVFNIVSLILILLKKIKQINYQPVVSQ